MPFCLSEYVSSGEIVNTRKNSVHGYLAFRGCDRPVILQLTGNCGENLAGRHLRFEVRSNPAVEETAVTEEDLDQMHLAWIQIGVPKEMTFQQASGTLDDPIAERLPAASDPDRTPPCLCLEWHSQNGHTIIRLVDPLIEFVEEGQRQADEDALTVDLDDYLPLDDPDQELSEVESDSAIASDDDFEEDDDGEWTDPAYEQGEDGDEDDDPFGLFPKDLESKLDASKSPWHAEPDEETLKQWKDWDEVLEGTKDVPLSTLFDPPLKLPSAESLDDEQVACQLNHVLARLALHNVAFHMCEHFTPRTAYKLLLETILPEESTHPELPRIGYTMNFDTSESCDECAADFERRYAERNPKPSLEDSDGDDDVPF
jgi:hypothetical protein